MSEDMVQPFADDDAVGINTCETCDGEYMDGSHCKNCGLPLIPECFSITATVNLPDVHDIAFDKWLSKHPHANLKLAFLAGANYGLDLATGVLKK